MAAPLELAMLQEIFKDKRQHIGIGVITQMSVASDRSFLKCMVSMWPEQREIVCRMSWDAVGPESGIFQFPMNGDLVVTASPEGDESLPIIIKRLTSKEDKIPLNALDGHLVLKALAGKKIWATSNTRINLSKTDTQPTSPIPLGDVLADLLSDILTKLDELSTAVAAHKHISGPPGYLTLAPDNAGTFSGLAGDFTALAASPVDDNLLNSDLAFTEKG